MPRSMITGLSSSLSTMLLGGVQSAQSPLVEVVHGVEQVAGDRDDLVGRQRGFVEEAVDGVRPSM